VTRYARRLAVAAFGLGLGAAGAGAGEPSVAHREGLRRTAELRKERRRGRGASAVGSIVPYPMPPVLVIRQTPAVHDEVEGLLDLLRR